MIVELQVVTPTELCEEQKDLLREFEKLSLEHGQHKEQEGFFSRLYHEVLGRKPKEAN